jgi:hypothetical protein
MVDRDFEEEYMDVFQNLEAAIITVFKKQPELTDYEVENAIEALIRTYQGTSSGRAPVLPHSPASQTVYQAVQEMCEIRLGHSEIKNAKKASKIEPITMDILIQCLKRIRKSIVFWTKESGRQGYLQYISNFIR